MYTRTAILLVLALSVPSHEQDTPPSPCPGVFEYQKPGSETGKWEGVVHLTSDVQLYSVFLNIILTEKAQLLGNWLAESTTQDNKQFRIESTELVISPAAPLDFKFFVRFDPLSKIPLLQSIKFNGQEICNAAVTTESSSEKPAPPPPLIPQDSFETKPIKKQSDNNEVTGGGVYVPGPPVGLPTIIGGGVPTNEKGTCGMVFASTTLIRKGMATGEAEWPWHIALYLTENTDNAFTCGGTLVSHLHIITAAHCVTRKESRRIWDINRFHVLLGRHNLEGSAEGAQLRFLSNIDIHDDYNPNGQLRDIAILTMKDYVAYSKWIQPACLWPEETKALDNVVNQIGIVVGWGNDGKKTSVSILNKVSAPVVDNLTCLKSLPWFYNKYISDFTYCGGFGNAYRMGRHDAGAQLCEIEAPTPTIICGIYVFYILYNNLLYCNKTNTEIITLRIT
ncbi:hypothetical protein O3G_MSEX004608 [Manduca sexta]|uniref:Peptidase S1 domain-containing protein n=1 Tax=Manduca sexta TaxID=7130 RepID=A0A922CHA2_MANSE|nr:hypothetical protein O3G_MSEX004608 [Manduca sexta]